MTELADDLRLHPARPARHPVGHELRVRHARRRHADVVHRPPRRASSSGSCGSAAASRPTCSSATTSATATSATTRERPYDAQPLVEIANALSLSLGRSLDWIHLPGAGGPRRRALLRDARPAAAAARDPALPRRCCTPPTAWPAPRPASSPRSASCTTSASRPTAAGAATAPRTWRRWSSCTAPSRAPIDGGHAGRSRSRGPPAGTACPTTTGRTSPSTPSARPTTASTATAGTATSIRRSRSWPTCSADGDVMIDYSGGTGILLDRLKLRMFDTQVGADHRRQLAQVPPGRASRSSATIRRSGSGCCAS